VSTTVSGGEPNAESTRGAMSPDGRAVIWDTMADHVVPGDTGVRDMCVDGMNDDPCADVFLRTIDPTGLDLTGDGDAADTVLMVLDGNAMVPPLPQPTPICPAAQVAVANGKAAFLRPEASGNATGCPTGPAIG